MANIIHRPEWYLHERSVTPEAVFLNRRQFLRQLGFAGAGLVAGTLLGWSKSEPSATNSADSPDSRPGTGPTIPAKGYPAQRNQEFNPGWRLTNEKTASTYNNFYEFSPDKDAFRYVGRFVPAPWPVQITGLVEKPMTLDSMELVDMFGLEERIYRLRCVEAWAIIVPWTGFPFSKLIQKVMPKPKAKFVRFQTFDRPDQAP